MEDLKEYIERTMDEMMAELGLEKIENDNNKDKPITGTITFLKGESAKKAAEYFRKRHK
jgi:nucleoid-associated protein YejK